MMNHNNMNHNNMNHKGTKAQRKSLLKVEKAHLRLCSAFRVGASAKTLSTFSSSAYLRASVVNNLPFTGGER